MPVAATSRKLSASVGQNWSMITPWGMYMNPNRTGGLYACFSLASAQPMASNRGKARVVPTPFRQTRRSIVVFLLMVGSVR